MSSYRVVRDIGAIGLLILLAVVPGLGLAIKAGVVGIPHNDDWVYILGANALYRTGSVVMSGHAAAAVGQLILVQPLLRLADGQPWAFTAFGLGMAAVAVAASYLLARCYLGRGPSLFVALLVIAFPGFARESASFMTDISALALEMLSLLLGVVWIRSGRPVALAASLLIGVAAVSIREFAVVAPAAVLVAALAQSRPGNRIALLVTTAVTVAAVVAVLLAARSPALNDELSTPRLSNIVKVLPTMTTLAAVLLPAIVLAVGARFRLLTVGILLAAMVLVGLAFVVPAAPLIGNTWAQGGIAGNAILAGSRAAVITASVWSASTNLAVLAGILAVSLILAWGLGVVGEARTPRLLWGRALDVLRQPTGVLVVFLLGYVAALAYVVWRLSVFDRYLYPMVPPAAILLLGGVPAVWRVGRAQVIAYAGLLWLAASSAMVTTNSLAYDAARWQAGEAAVAMGYAAATVDAGYEWVGYHSDSHVNDVPAAYGLSRYTNRLMPSKPCAVVSNSALTVPGYVLLRKDAAAYRSFLVIGSRRPLYLYGLADGSCPKTGG